MFPQFCFKEPLSDQSTGFSGAFLFAVPTTTGALGFILLILLVTYSRVSKSNLDKDSLSSSGWFSNKEARLVSSYLVHLSATDYKVSFSEDTFS